ncbi:sensor histidine kinase [Clostridium chauvoei]|uniref:histidine kinase n=2 Tax=Clostridium chauvoei TaxID=46867 RepID=A0A1U6JQH0_9CLOT|nr:HAMP domain-containing sensor histidine kinase [Clostridium chauvoei]ATD55973.1 two-component sensor histidine kinase [Clostridium chauvoei]MBX7281561.1 HAMP domain-containing histidine kinase [Clostridium chauvoei]MBX7284100.1 HAMP domain-containing histidine kinase [Clostridium chauvoei]MBX7286609.1 HAMP domain-containing histidine kinase [Clostridium chauvoei]MBX7289148.1 HAMP domain-containing histidine kinase [Clostridium chauvoei]
METLKTKSIKSRLIRNFFVVIFSIVVFLNILLLIFVRKYYYDNTEELLRNQIRVSTTFYNKYFSASSLVDAIYDNVDAFWNQSNAQVEILDINGNLLMDSIGAKDKVLLNTPDIEKAINGQSSRWIGKVDYYENKIMVVSSPIVSNGNPIGIIRLITSLEEVDGTIEVIVVFFLFISIVVLIIGVMLSILLSNSITEPVNSLIFVAERMADGDLGIRSTVRGEDEVGKLANTLNYMADELEKREQLKNEFISSVSHELRTPLTAIKGWAITLNDEATDKETLKVGFDIIEKETDRLTTMVEELLDFSRLINENISLRKSYEDVDNLIVYIKNYMSPRAQREGLEFKVNKINNLGTAYLDVDRLKQVLINLLDNSFKFTKANGNVSLNVLREDNYIKFIIEDNGVGISKQDLPKVKEKFFKGKNSKSQNGIGLSICDEIIKLHNGKFIINSTIDKGTKVEVIIPVDIKE